MSDTLPKISIITPSFNQGLFLEETIQSVLSQKYPNLEYIIIDGGSTDNSVEIIKKYENHLSYWVSEKDSGQSEAINKGLKMATGDIVAWLNSDDLYCNNTFKTIANLFSSNPKMEIIYGDVLNFLEDGSEYLVKNQFELYDFFSRISLHQPSIFWRRQLLSEVGILDEDLYYCMDYDLWMKLFLNFKSMKTDRVFSRFREHSASKTNSKPINLYLEYQQVVSRFFNSVPGISWKYKLEKSGIQYDTTDKKYFLKEKYTNQSLDKIFRIYLEKCLIILHTKRNNSEVNKLFFRNPQLFISLKNILTLIKSNLMFLIHGKNEV